MKKIGFCLAVLALSLVSMMGQVTVEIAQDQDQYLEGEAIPVKVRITNRSGQTLSLGADEDWVTFNIESHDGAVVTKLADPPVAGEFQLESSKVAIKHVNLAPFFSFSQPARYAVMATVRIKNWDREVTSPPKMFDIIDGAKLWEQEVGVPKSTNATNATPEVRRYMLQQANYLRGQLRLYLRVADATGKAIKVFPIGQILSFSRPEAQVDRESHLHVLYQSGPRTFSYTTYDPNGTLVARQTYEFGNVRPKLHIDEDGTISTIGGMRRLSSNDLPPSPMEVPSSEKTPEPASSIPKAATGTKAK
jgi:hypothetical protein